jgi:integrase
VKRSLTATAVSNAKPRDTAYKLTDGGGLAVYITPSGTKSWRYKYRVHGKERVFVIGTYPAISLLNARKAHEAARALVCQGIDPGEDRRAKFQKNILAATNTFELVARDYVVKKSTKGDPQGRWTPAYSAKVLRMLERELFPKIGKMRIEDVDAAVLSPIIEAVAERTKVRMPHQKKVRTRTRGAASTAIDLRQKCAAIFRHAATKGIAKYDFDPTWGLRNLVSKPKVKHNSYLELDQLPQFWTDLETVAVTESVKIAIELLAMTFARTGELRNAEWSEFQTSKESKDGPHWRIPAHKMKMRREHMVPLTDHSLNLLARLKKHTGHTRYLFPNRKDVDKVMNANTINGVLYKMGYAGRLSGHGFRATASTALHELGFPSHIVESQLSHTFQNMTAASYNHAEFWPERRKMMEKWNEIARSDATNVVPIKKNTKVAK